MKPLEISKLRITSNDPQEMDILNEHAAQGWQPYHVEGATHYFFREKVAQADSNDKGKKKLKA